MLSYIAIFCFLGFVWSLLFIIQTMKTRVNCLESEIKFLRNMATLQSSWRQGPVVDDRVTRMARMATANAPEWAADSELVSDFINKVERGDETICL